MATLTKLPRPLRQKLRDKAIDKVRQDIIHAGRHESDYSDADLAFLIGEKEKEIWSGGGWKGFGLVALALGINIGV